MHRFLVDLDLSELRGKIEKKELVHQLRDVLKFENGEEIGLFNREGREVRARLIDFGKSAIEFEVVEQLPKRITTKRKVILCCSMLKRDNFEWVVQKATEIGVSQIIPLQSDRSVKLAIPRPRLEKIIEEAVEQSGQVEIPELSQPLRLEKAFIAMQKNTKIFFDMSEESFSAKDLPLDKPVALFVGPEGGWTEQERKLAKAEGCVFRSLGPTILRAETAAIVGSFLTVKQ